MIFIQKLNKEKFIVFGIFILAFLLRIVGVNHSLPFTFHPDEPSIVRSALGIRFNPNPDHFDWPHLYIYINFFVYMIFAWVRSGLELIKLKPLLLFLWDDSTIFYILTRSLTAIFGSLTVIPIYLASKTLFNKYAGYIAAFILAVMPLHVYNSHYTMPDVPMVFFLAWFAYFSSKILFSESKINYILAGLFAGFATSCKYNGGLLVFLIPLAHLLRVFIYKKDKLLSKKLFLPVLSGVLFIFGFLIGTPFALLDYNTFSRTDGPAGAFWQFKNVGKVSFAYQIPQFFENMFVMLPQNVGYTPVLIFFAVFALSMFWLIKKKNTHFVYKAFLVMVPFVFIVFYVSGFDKSRAHYIFPAYPFLAMIAGSLFSLDIKVNKVLKYLFVLFLLLIPLYFSVISTVTLSKKDTRVEFYEWGQENIDKNLPVVYLSSIMKRVFEKLQVKTYTDLQYIRKLESGYVVISSVEDYGTSLPYIKRYKTNSYEVITVPSKMNIGPEIKVIKF